MSALHRPYFRLWVFPRYIIHAVVNGCRWDDPDLGTINGPMNPIMLGTLFVLHIWWWGLMNRIAYKLVTGVKGLSAGNVEYEYTMKDKKKAK